MVEVAVSIVKTAAPIFVGYNPETQSIQVRPYSRSYPNFFEVRFLCDYLINAIKKVELPRKFY